MKKKLIIVAVDKNGAIGYKNNLLCNLPADLKHFKKLTSGNVIIMGHRTFDSLPNGALPNRTNVVLSSDVFLKIDRCTVCKSLNDAFEKCDNFEGDIFFIGGAQVYKEALPLVDHLYLTRIHHAFSEVDTFFPEIDYSEWEMVEEEYYDKDEKNPYDYSFLHYMRKK